MKNYRNNRFGGLVCVFLLLVISSTVTFARRNKGPVVMVEDLRVENLTDPMGIDTRIPRLSWKIVSAEQDVMQESYHILVASSPERLAQDKGDLWDSDVVKSDSSLWISYKGKALKDNQRVWWKVRVATSFTS